MTIDPRTNGKLPNTIIGIVPLGCRNCSAALNQESKVAKILRGNGETEIGKTLVAALYGMPHPKFMHLASQIQDLRCRAVSICRDKVTEHLSPVVDVT